LVFAYHAHEFIPNADDFAGLVNNSPFVGEKLAGKIVGFLSKGQWKNFRKG
jgi:dihydroorotase-like cyclic amidohydrolase